MRLQRDTPDEATRRANALIVAFNEQLDSLRKDELEKREAAIRRNLEAYQGEVRRVRELQRQTHDAYGLHSLTQFADMVASTTLLRRRLSDLEGELQRVEREHSSLVERLGLTATEANAALKIASSSSVQKALVEFSDAQSLQAGDAERFGDRHPARMSSSEPVCGGAG